MLGSDLDKASCEEDLTDSKLLLMVWAIWNFHIGRFRSAACAPEQLQNTPGLGLPSYLPRPCAKSKFLAEILIASIGLVTHWSTHRITFTLIQELTAPALESITSLASQSGRHFKSLTKRNIVVWTMAVEGVSRYLGDLRYTFLVSEGSCFVSWKHLQSKLRAVQAREKLCLHFACYDIKVHTLLQFLPGCSVWAASVGQHKKFSSRLAGSRLAFNNSGRSTLDSPGGLEWSNSSLIVLPLKGFSGFT